MTRRRSAARLCRAWWPEAITVVFLTLIAVAGQKDDPLFAAFCAVIGALFWIMGHRHRKLPMQATLDGVRQDVSEVREIITTAVAAAEPPQADAEPVRNLRVVR